MNIYRSFRKRLGRIKRRYNERKRIRQIEKNNFDLLNDSIPRLNRLKNKFKGSRCFIVGNGPSLNKMDLSKLHNDYAFLFNGAFDLRENFSEERIFHVTEDVLVLEEHYKHLNELNGHVFLPSDCPQYVLTESPIICEFHRGFPQDNPDWPPFVDIKTDIPIFYWGGTVAYFALQLAVWLGFDEIYIIGVDLTYSIPDDIHVKGTVLTSRSDDPNHYNKDYFGKGKKWHVPEPERMLSAFERVLPKIKTEVEIYNAGVGGNLNCFTRVNFDSLFESESIK